MHIQLLKLSLFLLLPLSVFSQDSIQVKQFHDFAYNLELVHPDSAIQYYDSAASISKEIGYTIGEGRSYNYKAIVLFEQGKYLEAKAANQQAIPLFEKISYQHGIAASLVNLGNIELYLGNYDAGMNYYIRGIESYEKMQDSARLVMTLNNISSLFLNNQQAEKAADYAARAQLLSQSIPDSLTLADSYINLANAFLMMNDSAKYLSNSKNAYHIAQHTQDLYNQLLAANNIANYFIQTSFLDSADFYAKATLELAKTYNNPYNLSESLLTNGKVFYQRKDYSDARIILNEALEIAEEYGLSKLNLNISYQLYLVEAALGEYESANSFLANYTQLKDSINKGETQRYVNLLEQKFENDKKERTILVQQSSLKDQKKIIDRNRMLLLAGGVILLLLGLLAFFLIRSIKQKTRTHKEHVKRLKIEQQNLAMKAVAEGEEQERKRLSHELHDGVNGGLAAIKLMTTNFKKNGKSTEALSEIEGMLDDLSTEVRDISHNLMPGTLAKGSLKDTVEELVARFNHSDHVVFDFQCVGNVDKGSENVKFNTYRIIQELLKNVIKHADANECLVQLAEQNGVMNICVEDDGVGMNVDKNLDGIGLKNIRNRVEILSGNIEYQSEPGDGTSTYIDIPIN